MAELSKFMGLPIDDIGKIMGMVVPTGVDVSDADALVADVKDPKTFYSVAAPRKTGTMPTVAIVAANDDYPAGYHAGNAGGLDAIDTDLAPANIKTGVNIFGKVGTYDTTASAPTAAQIISGKVAWANGAQITGTMPTVALDPALNSYPAGYHAGAASLTAVDADLATGNIKSGITIFGVAGAATVQDISTANAAVGEVLSPKTFFSVTGGIKTGTMPTKTLNPADDTVAAGYYAATTLSAVDADLAPANIKSGVTIFGKEGTYLYPTLAAPHNNPTERFKTATGSYQKAKETKLNIAFTGGVRIKFDLRAESYQPENPTYGRIYRNGVAIGTERETDSTTYVTLSEDLSDVTWAVNDLIQIYTKGAVAYQYIRNFEISFAFSAAGYTDQDP